MPEFQTDITTHQSLGNIGYISHGHIYIYIYIYIMKYIGIICTYLVCISSYMNAIGSSPALDMTSRDLCEYVNKI